MRSRRRQAAILLAAAVGTWMVGASALAQTSGNARRWEIEGYGGAVLSSGAGEGTAALPATGAPIATSSPIFPSRRVPSWFFGDGASLLNQVNAQFDVAAAIQPLDAALGASGLAAGNAPVAGFRVRRGITSRLSAELSVDLLVGSAALSDELLAAVDASRDSFVPAFEGLLATGPFTNVVVTSSSSTGGSARELAITGAAVWHFGDLRGFTPYLTLGGGVISGAGEGATAILEGSYRFLIVGEVPIDETDRVMIRIDSRTVPVGVAGAGLRRDVTDRWGLRVDGRAFIGSSSHRVLIDADPVVAPGTPADFVESFTAPAIQFSNDPATGRESSLGAPGLESFEAFVENGLRVRVLITAGVFVRF